MSGVRTSRASHCLLLLLFAMLCPVAHAATPSPLSNHPSPYLAMHAADPVQWRLWGPAVLTDARRTGRLIFISSGYFACHWCHVMQRESFRDADIAALLNRDFIPVKIDREHLPALDEMLIEFARHTRGRAGWPLNVVLTPAGDPLFATMYAPPGEFMATMQDLQQRWAAETETLTRLAAAGRRAMHAPAVRLPASAPVLKSQDLHARLIAQARAEADDLGGGFGEQSKFPQSPWLLALLDAEAFAHEPWLADFLRTTLAAMAEQGLRDHLGGGFFRYTTDPHWLQPHFEKMLYDNAQLALVYLRAGKLFNTSAYADIAFETLDFIAREMCAGDGLCAAALSAVDEQGAEGGYYLWRAEDLRKGFTSEEADIISEYWQLNPPHDFQAGALPIPSKDPPAQAREQGISSADSNALIPALRTRLLLARAQRTLPIDDKRLCGLNGLLLAALSEAAATPGGARFRQRADVLFAALGRQCFDSAGVLHSAQPREMAGETTLDDMGQLAFGFASYAILTSSKPARALLRRVTAQAWSELFTAAGWRGVAVSLIDYGPPQALAADSEVISGTALLMEASRWLARHEDDTDLLAQLAKADALAALSIQQSPLTYAGMTARHFKTSITR